MKKAQDTLVKNDSLRRVPKLRFPEFRDAGEWEIRPLPEVADINPKRYELDDETVVSFIPMASVSEDGFLTGFQTRKYSEIKKGFTYFRDDDIIIAKITPCFENGKTAVLKGLKGGCGAGSTEFHVIRAKNGVMHSFLFAYVNSDKVRSSGKDSMAGSGGQQRVPSTFFENLQIAIPSIAEQQKIAACLSSLDDLIAVHTKKLDTLKMHKKGLMQQLFPTDGEFVPRLRFPEFRDGSAWVETTIGKNCKSYSGGTPSTTEAKYYGGDIPFIRSAEINADSTELFLTKIGLSNSSAKCVDIGDLLVALYGANSGDVAISKMCGAINQAILCLKSNECNEFVYQFLSFKKAWIVSTYIQGGQGNLSGEIIKSIKFTRPNIYEQKKIADFLSSIDDLIATQAKKIDSLKMHKKGLMQQLFPSAVEDK